VQEVVGMIGLGAMGRPMAANLERAGFEVAGYDIRGAGSAGSVAEVVARSSRAVIVLVRTRPQVQEVVS
jgi:2-hydroxy-3-oxopropionate reductase